MEHFDESEVREIGIDDRDYPELLRKIKKPPKALHMRGNLPPNQKIIAISGSRETTKHALDTASRIGKWLAQHGYTVVCGLAKGCDTKAAEGALSVGGTVVGVVPSGLKALQGSTKQLAEKVFAAGGAVLSEYPDNHAKVFNRHFLRRNEIITGLSEKTIIIAAKARSGSSATANRALRQGRRVIITRHVTAKIERAMIVKNPGDLRDALGMGREDSEK